MQSVIIEYARNVCGIKDANSLNIDKNAKSPVIIQTNAKNKDGHLMRLGSWKCDIAKDTKAYEIYKKDVISERHRHSYEVNKDYVKTLEEKGLVVSGYSSDENKYVEIVEIKDHPWFIAVQFNPEFQSRPTRPHPLFANFIKAALINKK
jgi:CTP synthase